MQITTQVIKNGKQNVGKQIKAKTSSKLVKLALMYRTREVRMYVQGVQYLKREIIYARR